MDFCLDFEGLLEAPKAQIHWKNNGFSMILDFWLIIKMSLKSYKNGLENQWKFIENWSKNRSKRHQQSDRFGDGFLEDFGSIFGAKIDQKSIKNRIEKASTFLVDFCLDFQGLLVALKV